MRRLSLDNIKKRKNHARNAYRLQVKILEYSVFIMLVELFFIASIYFTTPDPDFYSTNSASAIKPLVSLNAPNYSNKALLKPDIPEEMGRKTLTT